MKNRKIETLNDSELVDRFAELARQAGAAVLYCQVTRANRAILGMWTIRELLRSRGREAREQLVVLLDDQNRLVRYYAAKALLGLVPERARAEIEWNANNRSDAITGDARGLLRAFDTGEYRPD